MKYFILILIFMFLLSGCADKNAFSKFEMSPEQELSASSIQSSKIKSSNKTIGVMSAIYLNKVYPNIYFNDEYFFVYLYLKNKKEMYNPTALKDIEMTLRLNGNLPVKIKKLPHANKFSDLIATQNEWNDYYLVAFKKEQSKKLSLTLESDLFFSDFLIYQKDEQ